MKNTEIKIFKKLLPICSYCKQIRDDKGNWQQIESYISDHSKTNFTHGICPKCAEKLYSKFDLYNKKINCTPKKIIPDL